MCVRGAESSKALPGSGKFPSVKPKSVPSPRLVFVRRGGTCSGTLKTSEHVVNGPSVCLFLRQEEGCDLVTV